MRRARIAAVAVVALTLASPARSHAQPLPETPFTQDPLGRIVDVTDSWQRYQPSTAFCVRPSVFEVTGDTGATETGEHEACRRSGFRPAHKGLYLVRVETPMLCAGCRRLFLDYTKIPDENQPPEFDSHGHVYFRLQSANPTYTVDPIAHSPNIKNLTNDKLVAPEGSQQESIFHGFDLHAMAYTGDTAYFAHSQIQGPYYVGPWYLSRSGERIRGAYLDVDVAGAEQLPDPMLNAIYYMAGFNNGEATCPDNLDPGFRDGNYFYAGCFNWFGGSTEGVDPYSRHNNR